MADELQVSIFTVQRAYRSGNLRARNIGRGVVILRDDLNDYTANLPAWDE